MKKLSWALFGFLAIGVGLYPLMYFIIDMSQGLIATKPESVAESDWWRMAFYQHILFGGLSLLTGWTQFSRRLRNRNLNLHRSLGKAYLVSVLFGGSAGLYLAFYATGGLISQLGFGFLAILWLLTSGMAYSEIRRKNTESHRRWMLRSYALAFAAVTLRLYLPLFEIFSPLDFVESYRIIAWLCWVPNLVFVELLFVRQTSGRKVAVR